MKVILKNNWQEKWIRGRYKNGDYWKERIRYRMVELDGEDLRIEEGFILEHQSKEPKKEWHDEQQHLIGYHYFSLIDSKIPDKDLVWFQSSLSKKRVYRFFYDGLAFPDCKIKDFDTYNRAITEFKRVIKKKYNIDLEVERSRERRSR